MSPKIHAVADANSRPSSFFMTAGHFNDYTGDAALPDDIPKAHGLLGGHCYGPDFLRDALEAKGIPACIPRWIGAQPPS